MLKNDYKKIDRFTSAVTAYLVTALIVATMWFFFTKQVLLNLQSVPVQRREGYDDPYLSFLGLTLAYLLSGLIIYTVIIVLLPKVASSMFLKMVICCLACILLLICIRLLTFGLGLSDPGMLTELLTMAVAGALFPIVQKMLLEFLYKKN